MLWPRILGGVPRPYVQAASAESLEGMQELAALVEQGRLKVHVSDEFEMEDALQVSHHSMFRIHELMNWRHTINCSVVIRRVKWS